MGQLPEDAPFKAAHSSRNRARRMKAARAEARRLVGDALRQRDAALAELSSVKDQLTEANRTHERECAEFALRTAELDAKVEAAAENAASSHEAENLRRVNAETLESLESERRKTQSLMTRLGELKKRKGELGEIYDLHEGELETNRELRKDNAALTDSIAKAKVELETVSAERDELQKRLVDSSARVEELESSLDAEREGACRLRDSEQENTGRLNDLAQEKETLARSLAQTQKARADAVAALKAAQEKNDLVQADLQAAREESYRQRHDLEQKLGELERGNARINEQARSAQSRYDKSTAEYERKIGELQKALDSKQAELDRAASDSLQGDLESLKKAVESERERADRAEGKARAAELLQEDLETFKGKVSALRRQLAVCSSLKDDLADAETKLADATARASDAESRARAAERDSGRLSRELERVNLKLAEESSRAEGAKAALLDADGVRSLALPCGLLPGEETTVALGSGFQKFRVQKIVYKSDGTIFLENDRGQSVPMGTWR